MRVIPVIDILQGQVVRGVGGRRSEYRPIKSQIAADSRPATVARAFVERFGFDTAYVADLDAIMHGSLAHTSWERIGSAGLGIWLDAGVGDYAAAQKIIDCCSAAAISLDLVAGLESLQSPQELANIQQLCGGRAIFSLDMRDGECLTRIPGWKSWSPAEVVGAAIRGGTHRVIVLDLADVGERGGTRTIELCRQIRNKYSNIELVAGGGVRGVADLRALADAGCDTVLVASALHDGRLTREEIHQFAALL